jgi:hypothetical protein
MSEEYTHVGTVRRRPRTGQQSSQSSSANGEGRKNGANGSHARSGRESRRDFERESYYDRAEDNEFREPRRSRSRFSSFRKEKKPQSSYAPELDEEPLFRFPFDPWRLYGAAKRNFGWILCAGAVLGLIGFFVAMFMVQY